MTREDRVIDEVLDELSKLEEIYEEAEEILQRKKVELQEKKEMLERVVSETDTTLV